MNAQIKTKSMNILFGGRLTERERESSEIYLHHLMECTFSNSLHRGKHYPTGDPFMRRGLIITLLNFYELLEQIEVWQNATFPTTNFR